MQPAQLHALFPTLIYTAQLDDEEQHKDLFTGLMGKYGFETTSQLVQGEYAGKADMHLEPSLAPFMKMVTDHVQNFLSIYALKTECFDYYVSKTCFAILDKPDAAIGPHSHSGSDVTFVYYVETPENAAPLRIMNTGIGEIMDGLLNSQRSLDRTLISEYNQYNCQYYMIEPKAGTLALFLGNTSHMVAPNADLFAGRRLSVAGDVNLVLKREHNSFEVGKPSLDVWKKF